MEKTMNEVTTTQQQPAFTRQNQLSTAANHGAVSIEQERAIAEAQGQLILAKKFPRDLNGAYAELMDACKLGAFANAAFYSVPRAGSRVTGPSIRLAEEVARCYGNFQYGHRELSRGDGKSEVEVFAWDMEKNNRSIRQITVTHTRDTKDGQVKLRDQKDIDDKIANVASKQVRGRVLALLPKWLVESAIEECKKTIAGTNDEPVSVRVRRMVGAFAKFGVNVDHLEKHLGHSLDDTTVDELVDLMGVFNAIKEGAKPSEFFSAAAEDAKDEAKASVNALIGASGEAPAAKAKPAAKKQDAAPAPTEAPTPAPTQSPTPAPEHAKESPTAPPEEPAQPSEKGPLF
jgi:hypothetical protein